MKTAAAVLLALAASVVAAAGATTYLAWLKWQEHCCDLSEHIDNLVVCTHGKAWYRGAPRAGGTGPARYLVVPGYMRVTEARALRIMRDELDVELVNLVGEVNDDGGHHG